MKYTKFELLKIKTKNTILLWKDVYGIAPNASAAKLYKSMLEWQSELTNTLEIWVNKGLDMSVGELILARANLGAVVESWLKFFYCVYYEDYCKDPITYKKKSKMVEPENAKFEDLNDFCAEKLWDSSTSTEFDWVDSVRHKRNAIHSFNYRDIGTPQDFLDDMDHLCEFADNVISHLPPIEDCIETYPEGYQFVSPFF